MDGIITTYWPQLLALLAFCAWLIRLEATQKAQGKVIDDLRTDQAELSRRAQDQAITLARIDESLSAIKITLDRLAEQINRRAA